MHASIQAPKDWHLILIVLLITSAAIALVVGKTIPQWNPPFLRRDQEESEGRMVRPVIQNFLFLSLVSAYTIYTELRVASMVATSMKFSNLFTTQLMITEEALTSHCGVSLEIIHTSK